MWGPGRHQSTVSPPAPHTLASPGTSAAPLCLPAAPAHRGASTTWTFRAKGNSYSQPSALVPVPGRHWPLACSSAGPLQGWGTAAIPAAGPRSRPVLCTRCRTMCCSWYGMRWPRTERVLAAGPELAGGCTLAWGLCVNRCAEGWTGPPRSEKGMSVIKQWVSWPPRAPQGNCGWKERKQP